MPNYCLTYPNRDHAACPSSVECQWTTDGPTTATMLLWQMEAQLQAARKALVDEAEGEFRKAAILLEYDATALVNLVRSW